MYSIEQDSEVCRDIPVRSALARLPAERTLIRMLVGIHQLHYMPWLRYFEKIARVDVFVVLDNIQYNKNGWQNRNKVKTNLGAALLTVPVIDKFAQRLDEVRIAEGSSWRKKHWRMLQQNYSKAPYFDEHARFFAEIYQREWTTLNDLNRPMLHYLVDALQITTPIAYASELNVPGLATDRLVNLIKAVEGDTYYSGAYALDAYLDASILEAAGIGLVLQHWEAPVYPQLHGDFVRDLAVFDLLMNCGPDALSVLKQGSENSKEQEDHDDSTQ